MLRRQRDQTSDYTRVRGYSRPSEDRIENILKLFTHSRASLPLISTRATQTAGAPLVAPENRVISHVWTDGRLGTALSPIQRACLCP